MEDIDNANPHHSLKTSFSKGDMSPLERKAVEAEALATIIADMFHLHELDEILQFRR